MRRWRVSLATKSLALQLGALGAIVAAVGAARQRSIRAQVYREIETSAQTLIQAVDEIVSDQPELLRSAALDAAVQRLTLKLPSVAGVSIVSPDFTVLADSRLRVGAVSDQSALLPLLHEVGERRFYYETGGSRYLRVSRSLHGHYDPLRHSEIAGAMSVDMLLTLADAAIARELWREMLVVMTLLVPIGVLMDAVARRWFVRPLERLADAGTRFARGETPAPLAVLGRDELSAVARTFNEMVAARTRAQARIEELLEASEGRYRLLFYRNPQPMFVVDRDTHAFLAANDAAVRDYGYSLEEFCGMTLRHILPGEDASPLAASLRARNGSHHRKKDGTLIDVEVSGGEVLFADKPAYLLLVIDITERKRAEERQRALVRKLQQAIAEVRTVRGLIRVCSNCRRVLTDQGSWQQIESYVREHTEAEFSHGLCPDCADRWTESSGD